MDDSHGTEKRKARCNGGQRHASDRRVPLLEIALHEPSDDLRDLVVLVADLAEAVADSTATEVAEDLRIRAVELRQRLAAVRNG